MWDNRVGKRNPRAPDFKCKDKSCDGVIWPPRDAKPATPAASMARATQPPDARGAAQGRSAATAPSGARSAAAASKPTTDADGMPLCPVCGGAMWDDRLTKRNPKAPDFKCRNKPKERDGPGCEGIIWPPRSGPSPYPAPIPRGGGRSAAAGPPPDDAPPPDEPPPFDDTPFPDDDDLPF
jgi:hypothetical protein